MVQGTDDGAYVGYGAENVRGDWAPAAGAENLRALLPEPDCFTARSLSEALKRAGGEDVFICGGAGLYEEALPLADRLYLTELDREVSGDTFFPEIPEGEFAVKKRVEKEGYAFVVYDRKLWRY